VPTRSDRDSAPAVPARRADSQPWPLQGCGNRLIRAHARQLSQAVLRRDCHHLLMAGRPGTGESVAARVYAQLRIDILDRRLTPGERLKSAELAKRLGVGVNVIREALALLAAQNLVRVERNRGFYVTTLSPEARTDLTAARKINEGAALRLAVEQGEADWESEILAAHHRMASQPVHRPDDPATRTSDWTAAHRAFHDTLIEAADNHVLLEICQRLSDAAQLHRAWSGSDGSGRDVPAEHKALLDAALARQAEQAVALLEAHIE